MMHNLDPGLPGRRWNGLFSFSFLLPLLFFFLFPAAFSVFPRDFHSKAKWATLTLHEFHVDPARPKPEDGPRLKKSFLEILDASGLFFLQSDRNRLESIPLDLARWDSDLRFFSETRNVYKRRLTEYLRWLEQRSKTPVDFADATLSFPFPADSFAGSEADLLRRREAAFRFRMLSILYSRRALSGKMQQSASPPGAGNSILPVGADLEKELRVLAYDREKKLLNEILFHRGGFSETLEDLYLNTILQLYDAHSSVFSAADQREFTEMLSTTSDSYGFVLRRRMFDNLRVERVIPGSPAYRSGRIHKQDALLRIEFPDENGRTVEAGDLNPEDVNQIIYRSPSRRIIVTVRKRNGIVERVPLYRSRMAREENTVTGFILEGDRKIGYIYIPSFYIDWDNPGSPAVANDVAKEILKLKQEKIQGLILDLRDNGGGSLGEALSLAGLFIDEGPLCIEAGSDGRGHPLKDPARGSIYDGPLTVLVNGGSASASEIFAGAMQDYHRAVVVGSRTFGKASMQRLLPLVSNPSLLKSDSPRRFQAEDYIKITIGRLYNLSGGTHQKVGILPDVQLPGILEDEIPREVGFLNPLENGTIQKKVHFQPLSPLPIRKLAGNSKGRISDSRRFAGWISAGQKIETFLKKGDPLPLDPKEFFKEMDRRVASFEALEKISKQTSDRFQVRINQYDSDLILMDPYRKERTAQQIRQIQQDLYIEEAGLVTEDLIDYLD